MERFAKIVYDFKPLVIFAKVPSSTLSSSLKHASNHCALLYLHKLVEYADHRNNIQLEKKLF